MDEKNVGLEKAMHILNWPISALFLEFAYSQKQKV